MSLTGREVVQHHKSAIASCAGKVRWSLLECLVDAMKKEYEKD